MPVDVGQPLPTAPGPEWNLPEILDIRIRRIPFDPPRHRHFRSALAGIKQAVEFLVQTSGPIPARALGPALFIGDEQVVESAPVGYNRYRFLALYPDRLKAGASIGWGWAGDPPRDRKRTRYRYRLPKGTRK